MEKYFVYLSEQYNLKHTTAKGTVYRFFKDRPYLVKDEEDIAYFEAHANFQALDDDFNPVPSHPAKSVSVFKKYTKEELKKMKKSELIKVLADLGEGRIPRLGTHKIEKILELQGGEDMGEEEKQDKPETTETSKEPAEEAKAEGSESSEESSEESE